jgi:hypothetical protein
MGVLRFPAVLLVRPMALLRFLVVLWSGLKTPPINGLTPLARQIGITTQIPKPVGEIKIGGG